MKELASMTAAEGSPAAVPDDPAGSRPSATPALRPPGAPENPGRRIDPLHLLERFGLIVLFALIIVLFSILRPDTFATADNFRAIVTSQSVVAVAALALIFPLMTGRFDISVGSILGICAIGCAAAMSSHGFALVPAIAFGLAMGLVIGLVNGVVVARLGVNSIIGTLGTATVMGGLITAYTQGIPVTTGLSPTLTNVGSTEVFGIPTLFLIMLVISVIVWYLLTQTPFGRQLAAIGINQRAAELTGLRVRRLVMLSFVFSGLFAAAAGVLQVGAQGSGDPQSGGITFILPAIAAVFLGATTWTPGRFNVPGTIIALFFLSTTVSGLALLGAAPWVSDVFNGTAIVVAIALSVQFRRRRTGEVAAGI